MVVGKTGPIMGGALSLALILAHCPSARAADCPRPLDARRGELAALLAQPAAVPPMARPAPAPSGAVVNADGVRLPLKRGGTAILPNDWQGCRKGAAGCEPAERLEIVGHYPELGATLVAGRPQGRDGALYRLVDDVSGAITAIGGPPLPSPSGRLAAVVAGDSADTWAGTEIWRLGGAVPVAEWEQDAAQPADYAFAGWRGDDTVLLAVRGLDPRQTAPLAAALTCAGDSWHLLHDTRAPWLERLASPSGHRHALLRQTAVVVWQDGEQVFGAPAVATTFVGWRDEDTALFARPGGGALTVRFDGGWRAE